MDNENDNLILIAGASATGKSLSLRGLKEHEATMYLNTESNKKLPFKSNFLPLNVTDPMQIYEAFSEAEKMKEITTVIVDSLTFMMDQYESQYVLTATNSMKAWGEYAQFFKKLMNNYVAKSSKNVIFTAHTMSVLNEKEMIQETLIKVKGSLMNTGIESFFSTVIATKKLALKKLDRYESDLLTYTDMEKELGYKYVFQTMLTKDTINERIRSADGMWAMNETFINNDVQLVLDRLHKFYK